MSPANNAAAGAQKRPDNRPREGLFDRIGAVSVGVAACAGVVYAAKDHPFVAGLSHDNVPLMHDPVLAHALPAGAIAAYLVMVHVVRPWYSKTSGAGPEMRFALQAWNLFLWLLSVVMLLGMAVPLYQHAAKHDFSLYEVMCDAPQVRWAGSGYFWVYIFALSKFAELIDTVFLVVRKRPVSFLHWYHHASVLAYTWYAVASRFSPGYFFAEVNAAVHALMYWYYYRSACGVKLTYDKLITQVQLTQMVVGIAISGLWSYYHLVDPRPCPTDMPLTMIGSGVVMYGSYLVLFASFYIGRYLKAQAQRNADKKAQ